MIFAGSFDGYLRIYSADNGDTLWDFNTAQEFLSVNGEATIGGSIESDGTIISNGKVRVNSGYSFGSRMGVTSCWSLHPTKNMDYKIQELW